MIAILVTVLSFGCGLTIGCLAMHAYACGLKATLKASYKSRWDWVGKYEVMRNERNYYRDNWKTAKLHESSLPDSITDALRRRER